MIIYLYVHRICIGIHIYVHIHIHVRVHIHVSIAYCDQSELNEYSLRYDRRLLVGKGKNHNHRSLGVFSYS